MLDTQNRQSPASWPVENGPSRTLPEIVGFIKSVIRRQWWLILLATALALAGETERLPKDRFIDGVDQSSFLLGGDELFAGNDRGRLSAWRRWELHAPRRVAREIPVLDRRFENAREQHPRVAHGLPPRSLPELLCDELLNVEPPDVPERPTSPVGQQVLADRSGRRFA